MRQLFRRCFARAFQTVENDQTDSMRCWLQHLESRLAPATILVNTILDNTTADGKVSLREALTSANNNADLNPDVTAFRIGAYGTEDINFDVAVFGVPQQISLLTALPTITGNVNFNGTAAANVTVARTAAAPSFGLFNCAISGIGNVSFSNMTLTGGAGTTIGAAINAGNDNLTVSNCVLTNNNAVAPGGGIGVGTGGGTITVTNTLFSLNSGNLGGAIFFTNTGNLVMDSCTMTGNKATGANGGGAIYNDSNTATIRNSTFNGNLATAGRGGALALQTAATVTLQNCTVAGNSATGTGGGIHRQAGALTLDSTIVAKNNGAGGTDILGIVTANFCLIGVSNDGPVIVGANNKLGTNLAPLDPLIFPLAFNGGPTPTRALMPGSPCINVGSNPGGLPNDQRGAGFFRIMGGQSDIGAYEEQKLVVFNKNNAGVGSLRQAIDDANKSVGPVDIFFDSFFDSPQTITLTTGELKITNSVNLIGPAGMVAIDGNKTTRIFNVDGPGVLNVDFTCITMNNGNAGSGGGGAIRIADEDVTLTNCMVMNNSAAKGGGISLEGSSPKLSLVSNCIAQNSATDPAGGGGGISSLGVPGVVMKVRESTIANNSAAGHGGGIAMSSGMLELLNSTISGNKAGGNGGGIAMGESGGPMAIRNSTIAYNQAETLLGGGIFANMGILDIESCIIAHNLNSAAPEIYNAGTTKLKNSAVFKAMGFTKTDLGGNLDYDCDPATGPLADNGGPTPTHALLPGSPALNKGSNPASLATDQRGPGFVRVAGPAADMGAFEVQVLTVLNANDNGAGSLRQAIDDANKGVGPSCIVFDSFFDSPKTITLTTGELKITDTVEIIGPTARLTISGNNSLRIFNIDGPGVLNVHLSGLTIKDGNAGSSKGGGIRIADEFVKLFDVFRVENCTAGDGGGIALDGTGAKLECQDGSVRFCTATNASGGGGGISSLGAANSCIPMTNWLVSENSSAGHGGGIAMSDGMLALLNCTVSGNKAHGHGGGIALTAGGSGDSIQNSTITNNQAETLSGGGIYTVRLVDIESSIVSLNVNSTAPDVANSVTGRLKWSAVGSSLGFMYTDLGGNLDFDCDPMTAPLADNGGVNWTHALLPFSPCLQKGSNPAGLTTDGRGLGYLRVAGGAPDMGAYENQMITPAAKVLNVVINDGAIQRSRVNKMEIMFDQGIQPEDLPASFQLKRHADGATVLMNGVMGPNTMSVILTFAGGAVDGLSLADGLYDLTIVASKVLNASGLVLDSNGDGTPGDDYKLMGNPTTNKLFRLFGDDNADGSVTAADFNAFRLVYGSSGLSAFDFNNDGFVTAADFNQFRTRYGVTLVP